MTDSNNSGTSWCRVIAITFCGTSIVLVHERKSFFVYYQLQIPPKGSGGGAAYGVQSVPYTSTQFRGYATESGNADGEMKTCLVG